MSLAEDRARFLDMTGRQYAAYLETLMSDEPSRFPVISARELIQGRPSTPDEIAHDAAIKAHLAEQGARYAERLNDAATDARERIRSLHGEKAAKFFETVALNIKRADKFSAETDSEPELQLQSPPILRVGSGMHPGDSGSLKTFAEIHIAAQINVKGGKALMIVAEGARGYKRRIRAYAQHHGIALKNMPTILPMAVNLFEANEVTALIEAVRVLCPGVTYVSIDTKWRCSLGAEENSATDQARVWAQIDRISRAFGCFVMCVAHFGKDESKGVRGSNSQYAAVDLELTQKRTGDYCTLTVTKAKDFEDGTVFTYKAVPVQLGFNQHGEPETSLVLEEVEAAEVATTIKPPKGEIERAIWDYAQTLGERFTEERLVNDVCDNLRKAKPKLRPSTVRRSVQAMTGDYFTQYGEELSVRAALVRGDEGWID